LHPGIQFLTYYGVYFHGIIEISRVESVHALQAYVIPLLQKYKLFRIIRNNYLKIEASPTQAGRTISEALAASHDDAKVISYLAWFLR
jgi:hypothetical protein